MNDPFRRRGRQGPVLSPDQGKRQGRVVRAAQAALGNVDAVRAFLNTPHDILEGRPIDLAIESDDGLAAVEAAIATQAAGARAIGKETRP